MNCSYCKTECDKIGEVYYDGGPLAYYKHRCYNCPVIIEYYSIDKIIEYRFIIDEKNYKYRVYCNVENNYCIIQSIPIINDFAGKAFEIELDFVPEWSPHTIKEKIKLYLIFS